MHRDSIPATCHSHNSSHNTCSMRDEKEVATPGGRKLFEAEERTHEGSGGAKAAKCRPEMAMSWI